MRGVLERRRPSEDHLHCLCLFVVEARAELDLERANRPLLPVNAPRLERADGGLDFLTRGRQHADEACVIEESRWERKAKVDGLCREILSPSDERDGHLVWRLDRTRAVHCLNSSGEEQQEK